ncbi:T6SS phospholipase effector Tle1-like catalytic domain-containing protein [Pseudomonas gingeri]|uniref:T6SS phospholipase effector Tle1-like catalytic domain-containing protein n=1 Tax=Pseudomonas gingeri TaxID=117681 RepID=UPI0015A11960|nr:DUF2235 domain-containing protein [Pseudomonas gingeri]NWA05002.1 DUF2235 domain-containing protein [Pseudomonas gingeri]NWA17170.1 DUF2235 domain-containing protein [Pseudomonas gingeri]NWA59095.1 DUF2235 domain-containing protein [Pseudomonas gingeri]NWA99644.1 DUF2235 domain-containing protein [Pseudomonas gingeri]NWB06152.1 DUF2235 domain-containing protein [Pseudomonas gingeri]
MSAVKHAPLWYPPQFPVQGRLPSRPAQVQQNIQRQCQLERDYHNALAVAAGRRGMPPCCKTLHISLCFDGTGNNLNHDFYLSDPRHPTNIARMFRASIGDGYAGGTAHSEKAQWLTDAPGTGNGQYFKYYMPGVGTPFPEVGDLNYSTFGLALASYGEERINWGLLMIIDALRRTLGLPRQDNATLFAAVKAMGSSHGLESVTGQGSRRREFYTQLASLLKPLGIALSQPNPGHPKLLGIKLYVYGFSRGAAAARAFVSWLNQLLSRSEATPSLKLLDMTLPISVEYLGLLDTVASVGVADIIPGAQGHMGWADGSQELPSGSLVKRCLHIVAGHEQRLCFPSDSIRRESGEYPANSVEVLHPGVHSDQGGGYPPGDQGKACSKDNIEGDGLLLSQIALHDLYADAFAHGAPLKVPEDALPVTLSHERWRVMTPDLAQEFEAAPELVNRFNAWRQVTLGLIPGTQPLPTERAEHYQPLLAQETLEQALRDQMGWITAWRIDRYAFASLKQTPFYLQASDIEADKEARQNAEDLRNKKQAGVEKDRKQQLALERLGREPKRPMKPGIKDFDPEMAQTQLREAAEEFAQDYRGGLSLSVAISRARLLVPGVQAIAEARVEREQMKAAGNARVRQLFPRPKNEYDSVDESRRGNVDESRNVTQPEGLLRALFDDQVHDSRAWFLYAALGTREPFGGYLRERMVFFGDAGRRDLALYDENDKPLLADATGLPAPVAVPVVMDAERRAQALQAIDALWQDFYAKSGEVSDAQV